LNSWVGRRSVLGNQEAACSRCQLARSSAQHSQFPIEEGLSRQVEPARGRDSRSSRRASIDLLSSAREKPGRRLRSSRSQVGRDALGLPDRPRVHGRLRQTLDARPQGGGAARADGCSPVTALLNVRRRPSALNDAAPTTSCRRNCALHCRPGRYSREASSGIRSLPS
jgi:hypothetical protein